MADLIPPQVTGVSPLSADGGTISSVVDKLTVSLSEDLKPSTVNVNNRMVWQYNGHFYLITDDSQTWANAETYAQSLGGHLATVNDTAEQNWLYATFGRFGDVLGGVDGPGGGRDVGVVERTGGDVHELGIRSTVQSFGI